MENAYSFVVSADELKSHSVLQDIMERILKLTIECEYFIQEYAQRNFGGKIVRFHIRRRHVPDNKLYLLAAAMTLAQLVKILLARDS
jgi:hypothetical protein